MNNRDTRSNATHTLVHDPATRANAWLRGLLFIGLLSLAGNAAAVLDVTLEIKNDADQFGNYTLIEGTKLKVKWTIVADDDDELHYKDKIMLIRVSDDALVVDKVNRGGDGKTSGTVNLTIPNAGSEDGDELFVRYQTKGNAGFEVVRIGLPADDGPTLRSIDKLGSTDLSVALHQLTRGAVSVQARAFHSEDVNATQLSECAWNTENDGYGFFDSSAGGASSSCDLSAGISLPHGRTVTELHCTVVTDTAITAIDAQLNRVDLSSGSSGTLLDTPNSANDPAVQTISDTTLTGSGLIDNKAYAYSLRVNYSGTDFSTVGSNARFYGCSVYYE